MSVARIVHILAVRHLGREGEVVGAERHVPPVHWLLLNRDCNLRRADRRNLKKPVLHFVGHHMYRSVLPVAYTHQTLPTQCMVLS